MKTGVVLGVASLAGVTIVLGQLSANARDQAQVSPVASQSSDEVTDGTIGPDVIVGQLTGPRYWTQDATEVAYSIGTTSCNLGDMDLEWIDETGPLVNHHPVIGQTMYKISGNGRFLQIGQSWLKHGFCALQGTICGACDSYCGGCCDHLGPGCSDPYSASRNGGQGGLGPKWQVNPHTGVFPIPWDSGEGTGGEFRRRLRVKISDLDTSLDPGAQFLMEGQYVTQDDAAWGNQNNNASYVETTVNQTGTYSASFTPSATVREKAAIEGWADLVEGVQLEEVQIPDDGLLIVGSYVHQEGDDYVYEYSVFNMNADRAVSSFVVPVPAGVTVTSMGFHDVDYHSGEVWDNTDWGVERNTEDVTWSNGVTYEGNETANAIRWGTAYSFWFASPSAPVQVDASLGLFKPGTPDAMSAPVQAPESSCTPSNGDTNGDTFVDVADLLNVLGDWGCAGTCVGDTTCDLVVNIDDLLDVLANWD